MDGDREDRIRARAHAIWVDEGRPDGGHEAHWHRARAEIDREDGVGDVTDGATDVEGAGLVRDGGVDETMPRAAGVGALAKAAAIGKG